MLGTVGALILNIQIQNPLKIGTFRCSDLGWFSIKMLRTIATAVVLAIQKRNQYQEVQNGAGLHLEWSGCSVLECHSKSKPFNTQTTFDHSKSKCQVFKPPLSKGDKQPFQCVMEGGGVKLRLSLRYEIYEWSQTFVNSFNLSAGRQLLQEVWRGGGRGGRGAKLQLVHKQCGK